jgi:hypothetical protein
VFGGREAGRRTWQGSLATMLVVVELLRGRWERGGAVADTKGDCSRAQLGAVR